MIVFTISVFLELDQSNLACVGVSVWLNNSTSQSRAGAERLPILEYHDLTLSRFSRYVWEAVDLARLPCSSATVCPYLHSQSRPRFDESLRFSATRTVQIFREIQNDEIGRAVVPGHHDPALWLVEAGEGWPSLRLQECENGWEKLFKIPFLQHILYWLCLADVQWCEWQMLESWGCAEGALSSHLYAALCSFFSWNDLMEWGSANHNLQCSNNND